MLPSLMLLGLILAGPADAAADDPLRPRVRELVHQLDADELAAREVAEEGLLKMGPQILPLLPRITVRTSAEVRLRLGRVRQQLQKLAAEAAASAATVTLHLKDAPLSEVLAAIEQQTGNRIVDFRNRFGQPATDPKLSVDFDDEPFWRALDQVLDQAQLAVYTFGGERAVCVVARTESQGSRVAAASYSGPFRFEPLALQAMRDLRDPQGDRLKLKLEIAWEPRLKPISLRQRMADLEGVDAAGRELTSQDPEAQPEVTAGDDATAVELILPFALPPRDMQQITSLKGTLTALIPGNIETFRFGDLMVAKDVQKRSAGVTVTLQTVRRNGPIWEVRVLTRFDQPGDALASHRGWIHQNEAYLEDPQGNKIEFDSLETTRQTENEIGVAYLFALDNPPAKHRFVYRTPGVIVATRFEYELKDIKLP